MNIHHFRTDFRMFISRKLRIETSIEHIVCNFVVEQVLTQLRIEASI